jgi:DNA-binding ferritin-like protein (Dps family)
MNMFMARMIDQKRRYRQYKARIAQLPEGYRTAVGAMERYTNYLGGLGDGESILSMMEDLADLFEQGAARGTSIRKIVGQDPVEFAETFLSNYPRGSWIVRERKRLTDAIDSIASEGSAHVGEHD